MEPCVSDEKKKKGSIGNPDHLQDITLLALPMSKVEQNVLDFGDDHRLVLQQTLLHAVRSKQKKKKKTLLFQEQRRGF
jgi:hypothetical protein